MNTLFIYVVFTKKDEYFFLFMLCLRKKMNTLFIYVVFMKKKK